MEKDEWLTGHLKYLAGLKAPSDHQRLLLALAEEPSLSAEKKRQMKVIIRAEKAAERARKARAKASKIVRSEQEKARKARNHEMIKSAGLLSLAGLLDKKTGRPLMDKDELLGALLGLAGVSADDPRRSDWKRAGAAKLMKKDLI